MSAQGLRFVCVPKLLGTINLPSLTKIVCQGTHLSCVFLKYRTHLDKIRKDPRNDEKEFEVMATKVKGIFKTTMFALLAAAVFIILGLVFFMFYLWIVKTGASLVGLEGLEANWAVFAAAILSAATIIGAAIESG